MGFSLSDLVNPTQSFDSGDWGMAGVDAIMPGAFGGGTLSPQYTSFYNSGNTPSWYDSMNGRDQVHNWTDDVGDFAGFQLSSWDDQFRRNPAQSLVGAGDPIATKMWNEILHKDWKPMVSAYGGPTQQTFYDAERSGLDTSNMRGVDNTARTIAPIAASYFGGPLAGAAMSGLGSWGDSLESGEQGWKSFGNGLTAFGKNYAGSFMPDWGLGQIANGTINGALMGAATGGSGTEGAKQGLISGVVDVGIGMGKNYLNNTDWSSNSMPEEGTLGGTMQDADGESSATLGGEVTPSQNRANQDLYSSGNSGYIPQYVRSSSDAPSSMKTAPTENNPVMDFINTFTQGTGAGGKGPSYLDMAGNALGMYNAYQQHKRVRDQLQTLRDMYSENSPYAQRLRSQLDRQAAASGRRSQSGARATQLQAMLAEAALRNQPQTMALLNARDEQSRRMAANAIQGISRLGQMYTPQQQFQQQSWNPQYDFNYSPSPGLYGQLFGDY